MTQYAVCEQCARCQHLYDGPGVVNDRWACVAFPNGIPDPIALGEVSHDTPYQADQGIQFVAVSSALGASERE